MIKYQIQLSSYKPTQSLINAVQEIDADARSLKYHLPDGLSFFTKLKFNQGSPDLSSRKLVRKSKFRLFGAPYKPLSETVSDTDV